MNMSMGTAKSLSKTMCLTTSSFHKSNILMSTCHQIGCSLNLIGIKSDSVWVRTCVTWIQRRVERTGKSNFSKPCCHRQLDSGRQGHEISIQDVPTQSKTNVACPDLSVFLVLYFDLIGFVLNLFKSIEQTQNNHCLAVRKFSKFLILPETKVVNNAESVWLVL